MYPCYLFGMPMKPETHKRNETVPVKLSLLEKGEFEEIAGAEDRPLGYVIRELALRGKAAYRKDHRLKEAPEPAKRKVEIPPIKDDPPQEVRKRRRG